MTARSAAVTAECCDEKIEDCSWGGPTTCNLGCEMRAHLEPLQTRGASCCTHDDKLTRHTILGIIAGARVLLPFFSDCGLNLGNTLTQFVAVCHPG